MMTNAISHSPRAYYDLRKRIWDSPAPRGQKMAGLAILECMRPNKPWAWPSRDWIARKAGIVLRTLANAAKWIREWFDVEERPGRSNIYRIKPDNPVENINIPEADPMQSLHSHPMQSLHSPIEDPIEDPKRSLAGEQPPACGKEAIQPEVSQPKPAAWKAAIAPQELQAQRDVAWTADGTLTVPSPWRDDLAKQFPRVHLETGLAIVQAEIGEARHRLPAIEVKHRIVRRFAFIESDERGKDRRYQERVEQAGATEKPARKKSAWDAWDGAIARAFGNKENK